MHAVPGLVQSGAWQSLLAHLEPVRPLAAVLLARQDEAHDIDDRLAAYVVTHLNLADALYGLERHAQAAQLLCAAHQGVLDLFNAEPPYSPDRLAALRHLRELRVALTHHQERWGALPAVQAQLDGAFTVAPHTGSLT